MNWSTRTLGPLLAIGLATAGCTSLEPRFTALEARQDALDTQIADLQAAQQNIVARLVQLRGELEEALNPLRTQSADRGEDFRSMTRELTALQEQYSQLDARIARMTEQLAAGGGRAAPAPGGGAPAMPPARGPRGPGSQPSTPESPSEANAAQQLYNSAFNDYLRTNYELCISGFQEYIRRYASSDRADDAQYWIGQCQLSSGQEQAAREAFATLIREYPESILVPDAMLNDGLILQQQGRLQAAIEAYRRLIQGFAQSDAAFLGCIELGKLGAERPSVCDQIEG